ncbi:uncharacterized protein LOC122060975 isoform X3 [Macadamia integrifolia]|uniref:uncharacterized protein LOC122060975 isoform X3 n=1 Tax=Macadamia integrifolia TaxID=60698 RepID=UPI001C52AC28|nr:uncharacterized protein LOC122060975 isoform X3 [Macadamia integrifolia]
MDEIHSAAEAYFKAKPKEKKKAKKMFKKIDKNGDGKVSYKEYSSYYAKKKPKKKRKKNKGHPRPEHFAELDRDHDGYLDIEDATVLYYLSVSRKECDYCGLFIKAMLYACEKCYKKMDDRHSYYLCVPCYRSRQFKHKHKIFLDNHVLQQKYKKGSSSTGWKLAELIANILTSLGGSGS